MRIQVLLFAAAKDAVGDSQIEIDLPGAATVSDLRTALVDQFPGLTEMASTLLIAVNNEYANDAMELDQTCEIACFPPVSGG